MMRKIGEIRVDLDPARGDYRAEATAEDMDDGRARAAFGSTPGVAVTNLIRSVQREDGSDAPGDGPCEMCQAIAENVEAFKAGARMAGDTMRADTAEARDLAWNLWDGEAFARATFAKWRERGWKPQAEREQRGTGAIMPEEWVGKTAAEIEELQSKERGEK